MKNYYYFIFIICSSLTINAQKTLQNTANDFFKKKDFIKAASMYEKIEENQEVLQNLGDCYYNNYKMNDAVRVYGKLFFTHKEKVSEEYYFKYAQALYGVNDIEKADKIMGEYKKFIIDTPNFISNLKSNVPFNYEIQSMSKNTTNGDFGMSFYGKKVAFASYRNVENKEFGWNDKPYLDLFSAEMNDVGQLENIEPFPKEINTKTHESSATFSSDLNTMYFSRTNDKKVKVGDEKYASIKIYKAEFKDGLWTNIQQLPFCSDTYSTEHPVLSKDGKKLYFSSDMPGTIGSFDIFSVTINDDGSFAAPENLGQNINTIHREQFPSISDDGTLLYFASDGHQGMGGLDIFVSILKDDVFQKPLNIGETINSNYDDFGYVVDESKNAGYLSSNRAGSDNLYSFKRKENIKNYSLEGEVRDKNTKNILPGTKVRLYDENDKLLGQIVVGEKADYLFYTEPNKKYRIEAVRDLYIPHSEFFTTNEQGKLRYIIELFIECYDDVEKIVNKRKSDGRLEIALENIYFDLNKWNIKPEAGKVLDIVLDLMNKYPFMNVELNAHTDSRASDVYNLLLSNKRAASALEYLVKKGIDRKRLKSKGFGESKPLVDCGIKCTEEENAINRRVEFIITK